MRSDRSTGAQPYAESAPTADMAAFSVQWLGAYKELVFEIARAGGVFFVNAAGPPPRLQPRYVAPHLAAHHRYPLGLSRLERG